MNSFTRLGLFCFCAFLCFESNAQQAESVFKKAKTVETVDFKSNKTVTITYNDGSLETMSEQEANKKGLINNGGYGNQKNGGYKRTPGQTVNLRNKIAKPLIVLDGIEVVDDTLSKINPDEIESINVLKGKAATDKYGVKGKYGVVEVNSKSSSFTCGVIRLSIDSLNGKKMYEYIGAEKSDEIVSFDISAENAEGNILTVHHEGTSFSMHDIKLFRSAKKGSPISFNKIYVKRNDTLIKLPAKVHQL